MVHWMCTNCGYYEQADLAPDKCPGCNQTCSFNNITCYRPDCGGESNFDPLLVGGILGTLKGVNTASSQPQVQRTQISDYYDFLEGLDDQERSIVKGLGKLRQYNEGEIIFRQGEKATTLFIVEEGQARLESGLATSGNIPLTTVNKGQAFGWSVLVPPYYFTALAVASTNLSVTAIDGRVLLDFIQSQPSIGIKIMRNIANTIMFRLYTVEQELVGLLKQNKPS
jgi:CRP/FNR family transcriptional regulator, cyclic AMP receptor protein